VASMAGEMPAQVSESQVPVANAQTSVLFGMALVTVDRTVIPIAGAVLKSALSVTS